jgi:hypothetical protein
MAQITRKKEKHNGTNHAAGGQHDPRHGRFHLSAGKSFADSGGHIYDMLLAVQSPSHVVEEFPIILLHAYTAAGHMISYDIICRLHHP